MQIHEITQPVLKEVLFDAFRLPSAVAADAAAKLTSKGYGPAYKAPSDKWEDKYATVLQDPAVKQYVKSLAQGWTAYAAQNKLKSAQPQPAQKTSVAPTATMTQPVMLGGKRLDPKNPDDAKILAVMQSQGKLEEAPQEYTTPSGIVVPAGAKSDVAPPPAADTTVNVDQYKQSFIDWSDSQLASRDPVSRDTITMNDVRGKFTDLDTRLDKLLDQIVRVQGTPQQASVIEEYFKLAVAGIQAMAQISRNKAPQQRDTNLGVSPQQLASLRALAQSPAGKDLLVKQLGL